MTDAEQPEQPEGKVKPVVYFPEWPDAELALLARVTPTTIIDAKVDAQRLPQPLRALLAATPDPEEIE